MYLAYLDPASGSMLAAAIVAGFAGVMVTVRVWWHRARDGVRRGWGKVRRRPTEVPAAETATSSESDR